MERKGKKKKLPAQLTFTTSSLKKRRIARPSSRRGDDIPADNGPALHSTTTSTTTGGKETPRHSRSLRPQQPPSRSSSRNRILPSTEREDDEPIEHIEHDDVIEGIEGDDIDIDSNEAQPDSANNDSSESEYDDDSNNSNDDDDALDPLTFSFTAASNAPSSGPTTPTYSRAGSVPLPPQGRRSGHGLEEQFRRDTSETPDVDISGSAASSSPPPRTKANIRAIRVPAANANTTGAAIRKQQKLQQRKNKHGAISKPSSRNTLPRPTLERSQSPLVPVSHRAIVMGGTTNDTPFHRSSSPLKRPASSMEQGSESVTLDVREPDVAGSSPATTATTTTSSSSANPSSSDASSSPPQQRSVHDGAKEEDVDMINVAENTAAPSSTPPPIDEQIETIQALVQKFNLGELQEGTATYLVSRKWLAKAQAFGSGDAAASATLGPVDNSDIIDSVIVDIEGKQAVRLNPGTGQDDFEFFSKEAWDLLVSWQGLAEKQLPIIRYAQNTAPSSMIPNVQFELHPPVFTVYRLASPASGISLAKEGATDALLPSAFMCSSNYRVQDFLKKTKTMLHIPMARHVRVWRIPRKLAAGNDTSLTTSPQDSWTKMLVPVAEFRKLQNHVEREHLDVVKDYTHDDKYNGRQSLAFVSLTVDQTIVLDENIERHLWVSTYNPKGPKDKGKAANNSSSTSSSSTSLVLANSAASRSSAAGNNNASSKSTRSSVSSGAATRSRLRLKSGRTAGCVGLGNLGNTCYMNSALQCVRSVEELTKYFLVGENEDETNYNNPLGHNGNVANAYASLLADIFRDNAPTSVAPRQFKSTIGRYAPAFSGYGQQDSQEFLGFLLDGLQEDLSRVKKKPYISKPDSTDEMIGNPAAIRAMADQVWDITKRRDDSVIADLFTGMYKSTLVCPVCQKVSITFDPFTNLTLPLPIQNVWSKTVKFLPLNDCAVNIEVELDKTSNIKALKDFVGARVGVDSDRLVATEEHRDDIFRIYDDFDCVSEEIGHSDSVILFEVEAAPTNNTGAKLPREKPRSMLNPYSGPDASKNGSALWQHPMGDRLLVPVVHRIAPSASSGRRFSRTGVTCPPHFIVVTREEAQNEDVIRRKILEKVASFSSWSEFSKAELVDGAEKTDKDDDESDAVLVASSSDVGSSRDGKTVTDTSVESEDDMVDVTMKDADANSPSSPKPSKVLREFNHHRPKWVTNPDMFLAGELQNLFDMSYYSDTSSSVIPIKWPSSTDEKIYPRLSSRMPAPPAAPESPATTASENGNGSESQEEAAPTDPDSPSQSPSASPVAAVTRMAQESDEDERPVALRNTNAIKTVPGPGGRRKALKSHQRYGVKNGKRAARIGQKTAAAPPPLPERNAPEEEADSKDDEVTTSTAATEKLPLIRLGEGIMVDWSPEGLDVVFGKDDVNDELRGAPTFGGIPDTLEDPELKDKRRNRISRKKRGLTLDECLDEFEREEILSENDMWYCPRCKEHRRASKKFDLWKTPDILVVHLKRFSSSGWRRDKLDMRVDFPVEGLDITKRVLDRQTGKVEIYDLIGVDDHWGGLGGGHYTAFARNFIDGQWYEYNDSSVSRVSNTSSVVSAAAYLLFYRRRSSEPLGGPRFHRIEAKFKAKYMPDEEEESEDSEASDASDSNTKGQNNSLDTGFDDDADDNAAFPADALDFDASDDDNRKSVEMDDILSSLNDGSKSTAAAPAAVGHDWMHQSWGFPSTAAAGGGTGARHTSPGSDIAEVDELEHADSATIGGGGDDDDDDDDRMSLSTDHAEHIDDKVDEAIPPPAYESAMDEIQDAIWASKEAKVTKAAKAAKAAKGQSKRGITVVHTIEGDDNAGSDQVDDIHDIHVSSSESGRSSRSDRSDLAQAKPVR
ncbi:ubiquitin specific peptidase 11 [Ophiostoma piceae UAMH 11346]|uniref:ubiquitinyl hydrolase 1 n=1 Tax=Ophiostoma piceae (strain UAMH 11346) TaxID=1262450 RepID=S3C3I5_OPHP1|nr:ubiquitin specific peptidase 11 [Ophiostoma piceae UAMH 11346]